MSYPHIDLLPINEATRNTHPSYHEADGLTILGLTHSFRFSLPIDKKSIWNGSNFYYFRLIAIIGGIITALNGWITWWLCSLVLPQWVIWTWIEFRILGDNRLRIIRTAKYIEHFNGNSDWHFWNYTFWLSWIAFVTGTIPNYWKLTVDEAFAPHTLSVMAAAIQYLESDEPLGWQRISLQAQLDHAFGYFLTSLFMADGKRIFSWLRWMSFWVVTFMIDQVSIRIDMIRLLRDYFWDNLIAYNTSAAELVAVVLFVPAPVIVYVWLAYMQPDKRATLYESSSIIRWFSGAVHSTFNKLEIFDLLGSFAAQHLADVYRNICLNTEKTLYVQDTPRYEYRPLEPGHVRLLVIRKLTWQHGFKAELVHRALAEDLTYEALSYHWGSSVLNRSILVSGKRMPITTSAFELLVARMSFFHERVVWIDAICINQEDLDEKSVQVPFMSRIYKQAKRVILVPSHQYDNRLAASLLYEIGTPNNGIGPESLEGRRLDMAMPFRTNDFTYKWTILVRLLQQPYFTRAWIVQEIAVGQDVQLLLGGIYVPWRTFHEAIAKLHNPRFGPLLMPLAKKTGIPTRLSLGQIMAIHALRPDSVDGARGNFISPTQLNQFSPLLALLAEFEATDERDKVYAVVGMILGTQADIHLDIDYGKAVADVYQDAGRAVLLASRPAIDTLAYAGLGWNRNICMPETSWTPVFVIPPNWVAFTDTTMKERRFRASGSSAALIQQGSHPRQLQVEGFLCDTILELVDSFFLSVELPQFLNTDLRIVRQFWVRFQATLSSAIELVQRHQPATTIEELQSALMADGSPGVDIPEHALPVLRSWVHDVLTVIDFDNSSPTSEDLLELWRGVDYVYTYLQYVARACNARRFGITVAGRLCIVPPLAEPGDTICIFHGAQTPYVIDKRLLADPSGDEWVLIGECYVQGIMQGELVEEDHHATMLTLA